MCIRDRINQKMSDSEAVFGIHEKTNRITIKIVDKKTKEVIREFPPVSYTHLDVYKRQLVNQAMELVEFDMALLKSMRQAPETANYNRQAYNTGELLGSGGFDAKQ